MSKRTKKTLLRIKSDTNGTYYVGPSPIGPRFGGTKDQAAEFEDGWDAYNTMKGFPLVVLASLVNDKDEECDIEGRKLHG